MTKRKITTVYFKVNSPFSLRAGGSGGAQRVDFAGEDTFYSCELVGDYLELTIKDKYAHPGILGTRPRKFMVHAQACSAIGFEDVGL